MPKLVMGFVMLLGVVGWSASASAKSSSQSAQVLIIIPERPDLTESDSGRPAFLAAESTPVASLPPMLIPARQRITTVQDVDGRQGLLETDFEPL